MESNGEEASRPLLIKQACDTLFRAVRVGVEGPEERVKELLSVVEELLSTVKELGGDTNDIKEDGGQTLLHVAAREGHLPLVRCLVREGVAIDTKNEAKKTALHIAAWRGHRDVVSFLLDSGARVSIRDSRGRNAVFTAAACGNVEVVKLLLERVKDKQKVVEAVDVDGHTALLYALFEGYTDVCDVLVRQGGADFRSIGSTARAEGHRDCASLIEGYWETWRAVQGAVRNDEAEALKELLPDGPAGMPCWTFDQDREKEEQEGQDDTLLVTAAKRGQVEVARVLLEHGADINQLRASSNPSSRVIKARRTHLDRGRALSPRDDATPTTPLLEAVLAGHVEMVALLLDHGAKVKRHLGPRRTCWDQMDRLSRGQPERRPLLCHASVRGDLAMVKLLIERKAENVNTHHDVYGQSGQRALWLAAREGHVEVVRMLLKAGADWTLAAEDGRLPRDVAEDEGVRQAIQEAEDLMGQISEAYSAGDMASVTAVLASHPQLVNGRLAHGRRRTLMMEAAEAGQGQVVRVLKKKGGRVGLVDDDGQTALMLAAAEGRLETVMLLLEGADEGLINHLSPDCRSALLRACKAGHMEVVKLLLEKGAEREPSMTKASARRYEEEKTLKASGLAMAAEGGHVALVTLLLEQYQWTRGAYDMSLLTASKHGQVATAALLLERVNLHVLRAALALAAGSGVCELVRLLITHVSQDMKLLRQGLQDAVDVACRKGKAAALRVLLEHGGQIDDQNQFDAAYEFPECSPVMQEVTSVREAFGEAARQGDTEQMARLVEVHGKAMFLDASTTKEGLPLQAAIQGGSLQAVAWLVQQGALLYRHEPRRPFCSVGEAIKAGDVPILRLLLQERERRGIRPCHDEARLEVLLACEHGQLEVIDIMIDTHRATGGHWFGEALAKVASRRQVPAVQRLVQLKQDLQLTHHHLSTTLTEAAKAGHREVVMELLVAGADEAEAIKATDDLSLMQLLMCAADEREYLLHKARCVHDSATVVPVCLVASRATAAAVPLPTMELAVPPPPPPQDAADERSKKRKRQEEEVVVEKEEEDEEEEDKEEEEEEGDDEEEEEDEEEAQAQRGGMEVVCEVARFVVEGLKADLFVELMEMMMPGEEQARRQVEENRRLAWEEWRRTYDGYSDEDD